MNKGEIAFFNFPAQTGGHEQHGTRPAILVSSYKNEPHKLITIIPLTTNVSSLKFSHTLIVKPDSINNLASPSVALIYQIRAISIDRMSGSPIGRLDDDFFMKLNKLLMEMLELP